MSARLFVSGALSNGAEIELDGDQSRYLGKVLRARIGDRVAVFNGEGPEWPATVLRISRNSVCLALGDSVETGTESPLKIHLVQGISRGERMDIVVQKATELGVKPEWEIEKALAHLTKEYLRQNARIHLAARAADRDAVQVRLEQIGRLREALRPTGV